MATRGCRAAPAAPASLVCHCGGSCGGDGHRRLVAADVREGSHAWNRRGLSGTGSSLSILQCCAKLSPSRDRYQDDRDHEDEDQHPGEEANAFADQVDETDALRGKDGDEQDEQSLFAAY